MTNVKTRNGSIQPAGARMNPRCRSRACAKEAKDEDGLYCGRLHGDEEATSHSQDRKYLPCCISYNDAKLEKLIHEVKKLKKFLTSLQCLERESNEGHLFECPECNFQTPVGKSFVEHFQVHFEVKVYSCTDCEFDTTSEKCFIQHQAGHGRLKKTDNVEEDCVSYRIGEGLYSCSVCSYKTNRKWNLEQHSLLHEETKDIFACHLCAYKTNFKRRLKLHLQDHVEGKRFQCPNCDYKTLRKGSLHQHMHIHSQQKRYECPTCSYRTNRKWSLRKHFKIHSDKQMLSNLVYNFTEQSRARKQHRKIHPRSRNDVTLNVYKDTNSRIEGLSLFSENRDHVLFRAQTSAEKELSQSRLQMMTKFG